MPGGSNIAAWNKSDSAIRVYHHSSVEFAISSGNITKITFEFSTKDEGSLPITVDKDSTGSFSGNVWTGKSSDVTLLFGEEESSGHRKVTSIVIEYEPAASDEAADDMEVVNAVYTMAGNVTPSDAGTSPILWISLISVGAVLISLGAVVVIFALRKKSE